MLRRITLKTDRVLVHPTRVMALGSASGPVVARAFQRALAAVFFVAFASLGAQVLTLVGLHGLLPAAPFIAALREQGVGFGELPSLFLFVTPTDGALVAGIALGLLLSGAALAGFRPRLCFAALTALYLSYAGIGRAFLGFQWDNLLLECGALAVLLPADRPCAAAHWALRLLLFKLYVESGIAKWGSPLGDWIDGSAMTFYFETAPIPTRLAWYAHHLPDAVHHVERWLTLFFELVLPFLAFGRRRGRLLLAAVLTGFQCVNIATANYGFFAYLAIALHSFLLDDADLLRARAWLARRPGARLRRRLRARLRRLARSPVLRFSPRVLASRRTPIDRARAAVVALWAIASLLEAGVHFATPRDLGVLDDVRAAFEPLRIANTYHLFAAVTRERVEPTFETFDGAKWTEHALRDKPGPIDRAPPFVAPHQPRVDFQLWFYGLSFARGTPEYVSELVQRLCTDRPAVQPLFADALPLAPEAVRIVFYRYRFTSWDDHAKTGAWWQRERLGAKAPIVCIR